MNIDEKVSLSEYDIYWETQFVNEKKLLQFYFPDVQIEHIGSTSVFGMIAKPIIDIMFGVIVYPPSEDLIICLTKLGYYNFGEIDKINGRLYFIKRGIQNFNVHVMKYSDKLWNNNILFRNYLRDHKDIALEYSEIKQNIIDRGHDTLLSYSTLKEEFILNIMNKIEGL